MRQSKWICGLLVTGSISACQAPLKLESFKDQSAKATQRYDAFQDAATSGETLIVAGSDGVVLEKPRDADTFTRIALVASDGSLPNFINLAECPSGKVLALSFKGGLWTRSSKGAWSEGVIDTRETVQDIACLQGDAILVSASFSSILKSEDGGETWVEATQEEDVMFTQLEFPSEDSGFAFGEFGTVVKTSDVGETWERLPDIGSEFYPLASYFETPQSGWVAGLAGAIYKTNDGALTWKQEASDTLAPIYKLSSLGSEMVAVGNYGTFLQRNESGSWASVTPDALGTSGYLRVVSTIPNESDKLLVAGQGYLTQIDLNDLSQGKDQ